ncbi:MAG: UvrD-helicase domain-containing protein, partial [Oscillospiraceae bacterium]|nr:UvrD-helicase domain-containing protein [Oscillospiraceae bacterium]
MNTFITLRKRVIERDFSRMNDMQRQAVFATEGPLLILAGAGSGKTTVLINRTANLIKYGRGYSSDFVPRYITQEDEAFLSDYLDEKATGPEADARAAGLCAIDPPKPWQIMAITFTNKAAGELKSRLEAMLGREGGEVWAATFHSSCARMLRRDGGRLGYTDKFTIYDADDQKRVIKLCLQELRIDEKLMPVKMFAGEIGRAKDSMISAGEYAAQAASDFRLKKAADVYTLYQKKLREQGAMDFDDLVYNTVRLLEKHDDIREYYQRRFKYIMVDEYQDTNHAQYRLIALLSGGHRNLCVVGDDDQSIYKFRGATIENILSFEKTFP